MSSTQEEQLKETTESSEKNSEQPDDDDEEDLEKLQAEIAKMEEEAERIQRQYKEQQQKSSGASAGLVGNTDGNASSATSISLNGAVDGATAEKKDSQSIYVGQVEYSATPEELLAHFEACGVVERVTIVCDKMSGRPKGFAYLEFQTEEAVANAIKLDGSTFKDRTLVVKGSELMNQALPEEEEAEDVAMVVDALGEASTVAVTEAGVAEGGEGVVEVEEDITLITDFLRVRFLTYIYSVLA
eukprot:CAMPEP_0171322262 /NCGR_PEP_ID=MMETSP0816-20121228/114849_1 /TAXON_ID=420281 /ORGANISM="Proboscia inermis, Strain CCAP1064/1" /LENGTH=242 /DNA_ID=CAMNT_0011820697 /DNA_START=774 /DNA_END=1503 /DNA_ORIENTATION=+